MGIQTEGIDLPQISPSIYSFSFSKNKFCNHERLYDNKWIVDLRKSELFLIIFLAIMYDFISDGHFTYN